MDNYILNTDGASKGNPGAGGAGIAIQKNNLPILKMGFYLNEKTNIEAEYFAMILGLLYLKTYIKPEDKVLILNDNAMIIKLLNKTNKCQSAHLQDLYRLLMKLIKDLNFEAKHVPRERNTVADRLANEGIANFTQIPDNIKSLFKDYAINL